LPTLNQPFIEHQTFRQTQTAFTARVFAEDGIDLLHSKLPVLGPPFELPFELPLFQAGAALLIQAGLPDDAAVRTTGMLAFLLGAAMLWLLVRHVISGRAAFFAVVAYVASPLSLLYGRASIIDHLAVSAALLFALAAIRWAEEMRFRWLVVGLFGGLICALVKLPTFVIWPLIVLGVTLDRGFPLKGDRLVGLGAITAAPIAAGTAWTIYADAIKSATPFGSALTTRALTEWNFGTLPQRFDLAEWSTIAFILAGYVIGFGWLPMLAAVPAAARRNGHTLTALAAVAVGVVPILIFFNLYAHHEYYQVATAPAWALLVGLGAERVVATLRERGMVLIAGSIAFTLATTTAFWGLAYRGTNVDPFHFLDMAEQLEQNSSPDELVLVAGDDWLPTTLYYAHRRGLAALYELTADDVRPQAHLYHAASIRPTSEADLNILRAWTWVAPVAPNTYRLGEVAGDVPSNAVRWTAVDFLAHRDAPLATATITCNGPDDPVDVTTSPTGTLIEIRPTGNRDARVWVGSFAPVPADGQVLVPPGPVTLACGKATSVAVDAWALPAWPPAS
jgi:4-amino-4-deoxy-L-arabinose transferase-like glycosyltransferase